MGGRCAVGLDVGGTKIHAGLVDEEGRLLRSLRLPTPVAEGPAGVFAAMRSLIRRLLDLAEGREVVGIGLGMPGLIDRARGLSVQSPNTGWSNVPVLAEFTEFGLPVELENDVRCHAVGEWHFGAGRGLRDFVLITVGTGIGSGVVLGGQLFQGACGRPGEIGHITVDPQGPLCGCGKRGCLEAVAGGKALGRRAREAGIAADTRELFARAAAGEGRAVSLLDDVARDLGLGISIMVNLFNPQRVIVGGGMAAAGDLLFAPMRRYAVELTMPGLRDTFDIVPAALGEEAGVVGAAALVPALTAGRCGEAQP
jgi:glucokinase